MLHYFILNILLSVFFQAPTYDITTSSITYTMKHKLHTWDGTSKQVNVASKWNGDKLEQISVLAKVSSFNSGLSSRDSHMIEVLDALSIPNITFSSSSIHYNGASIIVSGKLQFHGVTKDIQFNVREKKENNQLLYEGEFPVLLESFNVERPSLLFVKTDNSMNIKFALVFKNK
jgi:polyisoprenoid-binding protein YceI